MKDSVCGSCCYFKFEGADGWGQCINAGCPDVIGVCHCSDLCVCGGYVSEEEKRHHLAMLRKCQRCLDGNIGTKQGLDVKAVGEAIDFVVSYCKDY